MYVKVLYKVDLYKILFLCLICAMGFNSFILSFSSVVGEKHVNLRVQFESGYEFDNLPEVQYKYKWEKLNGFSGIVSHQLYQKWKSAPYIKSIELLEHKKYKRCLAEDSLDLGIDDIEAERVWGGYENA